MSTATHRSRTLHKADDARRVRDLLRARLLGEDLRTTPLPSELDLMREFQAGRNVVRAALNYLRSEALIVRKQGEGTFAASTKTLHSVLRSGVGASLGEDVLSTRLLGHRTVPAGSSGAQHLGVSPETPCLSVDSVTSINGEPTLVSTSYTADPDVRAALQELLADGEWSGGWYALLKRSGVSVARRELVVEAELADSLVAADLEIAVGSPMLFVRRLLSGPDGAGVEYGFSHCRGDRLAFSYLVDVSTDWKDSVE